ncbi:MAG: response regulator transcription factor [Chloroflexi bacterium]|nr:response regulator transcription factor [Chloroflexota bacterium]
MFMQRILIIADDPLARAGIAALLAKQPNCQVVGQSAREEIIADVIAVYRPDVIVVDWRVSSDAREFGAPVLALVSDANSAREAWLAGARGVLLRQASGEQIAAALGAVVEGLTVFEPSLAASVFPARESSRDALREELTPRESQVLRLLAEGKSNKTIARELDISEHTVKFHVNAILGKLNAQSRTEAVVIATRLGLVML